MVDLGLPFEQFDHYGLFRTAELVEDQDTTAKKVDKKGKSLGLVMKPAALDTNRGFHATGFFPFMIDNTACTM